MTRGAIRLPTRRVRVSRSQRQLVSIYGRADLVKSCVVGFILGVFVACVVLALLP